MDRNPRRHDARDLDQKRQSLREFKAARSGVLRDGTVIAGNGITEAARAEGYKDAVIIKTSGDQLVFVERDDLSDEDARRLAVADNLLSDNTEWDYLILAEDEAAQPGMLAAIPGGSESWRDEVGLIAGTISYESHEHEKGAKTEHRLERPGFRVVLGSTDDKALDAAIFEVNKLFAEHPEWEASIV